MRDNMMTKPSIGLIKSQSGFSLVELAIVMTIIGLLIYPLLQTYKKYNDQEKIDDTTIAMNNVSSAIGQYYIENGAYPCPADRHAAFGTLAFGVADCTTVKNLSPNTCSPGQGMCNAAGIAKPVYTGGIPFKTLGIPYTAMIDGYKNLLSYSVSSDYTDKYTTVPDKRVGSITYKTETKDPTTGTVSSTLPENAPFYVLVSYGEDGAGSFNLQGQQLACNAFHKDGENCDLNATFLDRSLMRSYANNSEYYDDRLYPVAYKSSTIWTVSQSSPSTIYNTNVGAVGIGTGTPDTSSSVKLDVAGDVKAQQFRSDKYCNQAGSDCFETKTVAGSGIKCGTGEYLIGVANNKEQCAGMAVSVKGKTCDAGKYISAISSAGDITCTPFP